MLSLPSIVFTAALLHVGPEVVFDPQMNSKMLRHINKTYAVCNRDGNMWLTHT